MDEDRGYRASMDAAATPEETMVIQELLDQLDLDIRACSGHTARGAVELLPWTLTIAAPIGVFFSAFAKKLGDRAGDAAADAVESVVRQVRGWIAQICSARGNRQGALILSDTDLGLDIVMPRDLSCHAYHQLVEVLETLPDKGAVLATELRWTGTDWIQTPL